MKRISLAAGVIVSVAWLSSTVYAFWFFQGQHLGQYPDVQSQMAFQAGDFSAPPGNGKVRLTLFWDDACPCSRYSEPHARELIATALERDEPLLVVVPHETGREQASRRFPEIPKSWIRTQGAPVEDFVSPSAAVHNDQGTLIYAGPMGEGSGCVTDTEGFLDSALSRARAGEATPTMNTSAAGCFCPWPS